VPEEPFPPYSFVPGRQPHPISDPRGHSHGRAVEAVPAPDPERWSACLTYLRGVDLFNHGYYWEAHEAWEGLWHACGRSGDVAALLKGLIHLAAAGVKVREGRPPGVRSHAERARQHFQHLPHRFFGLNTRELMAAARDVAEKAAEWPAHEGEAVAVVFDFILHHADPPSLPDP
jgi:hypothetical protein